MTCVVNDVVHETREIYINFNTCFFFFFTSYDGIFSLKLTRTQNVDEIISRLTSLLLYIIIVKRVRKRVISKVLCEISLRTMYIRESRRYSEHAK